MHRCTLVTDFNEGSVPLIAFHLFPTKFVIKLPLIKTQHGYQHLTKNPDLSLILAKVRLLS